MVEQGALGIQIHAGHQRAVFIFDYINPVEAVTDMDDLFCGAARRPKSNIDNRMHGVRCL